jgi:hypothetical protein
MAQAKIFSVLIFEGFNRHRRGPCSFKERVAQRCCVFHVEQVPRGAQAKNCARMQISFSRRVSKKNEGIRARLPDELRARLDTIHKKHLTNDSTVTVHMLEAFCDYVEKQGGVKLPVQLIAAPTPTKTQKAS